MNQKTTILFDMYGVILEESKGNFIPYTFRHFNRTEHERLTRQFREEQLGERLDFPILWQLLNRCL